MREGRKPFQDISRRARSLQSPRDGTAVECDEGRYPGDAEPLRQAGIFLGVDLHECGSSRQGLSDFPRRRREVAAVRSPGCPEFGQHGERVPLSERIERRIGQGDRMKIERWKRLAAVSAGPFLPLFFRRYTVRRSAGAAGNQLVFHLASVAAGVPTLTSSGCS
jgi:hypothetical protein